MEHLDNHFETFPGGVYRGVKKDGGKILTYFNNYTVGVAGLTSLYNSFMHTVS
jgi:hypothetical protein